MDEKLIDILKEMTVNGYGVSFYPELVKGSNRFRINVSKMFHDGVYHPMHLVKFVKFDDVDGLIEAIITMAEEIKHEFEKRNTKMERI